MIRGSRDSYYSLFLPLVLILISLLAAPFPTEAQALHALDHSAQDSLAAKAVADSVRAYRDSVKADSLGTGDDTVSYSAKRIRYRNDRFSLSEKALLTYRSSSLSADSIVFYSEDNVVEAMGAPLIQDPTQPPILGYKMRYNLKTKVGEIYYGSSKKDNQTFNGLEIRRQKSGDILIARGDFSTCDIPQDKHYFFYSRRMILQPKSKVLSGPIVMNVGDVPVAILPMMVMPLGSGRRSGLLQPKFGGDQSLGFYLLGLGYYWAINDYTDLLMSGDVIEGEQGTFDKTNFNSTFRYNKRYQYNGYLKGTSYVSEFDVTNPGWAVEYPMIRISRRIRSRPSRAPGASSPIPASWIGTPPRSRKRKNRRPTPPWDTAASSTGTRPRSTRIFPRTTTSPPPCSRATSPTWPSASALPFSPRPTTKARRFWTRSPGTAN